MARKRNRAQRALSAILTIALLVVGLAVPASAQEAPADTAPTPLLSSSTTTVAPVTDAPTTTVPVDADLTTTLSVDPVVAEPIVAEPEVAIADDSILRLVDDAEVLTPEDITPIEPIDQAGWKDATLLRNFEANLYTGSMYWVTQEITGAADYWAKGFTGAGVDVAIIDTGVNAVKGLSADGKIVFGPDLSFESQNEKFAYADNFGHGTHLAGIIAGRDGTPAKLDKNDSKFLGMAPDSRLVSVKVGTHNGAVDVSQVIAAIDWVTEHRKDNGLNIRVINLAYGTDSQQDWRIDPLSFAVERAWDAGIVVVVSAGNDGNKVGLRNPATNPHVISVGASESNMTYDASDDQLTEFSNCSKDRYRPIDVVAPGKSIVSLRSPGSTADRENPKARVGDRFFLGSGTSQAAAVVSGAVALIIDQRPNITPDQVKALLRQTSQRLPGVSAYCQGAGLIDLRQAIQTRTPGTYEIRRSATGTGSLEASRGSLHIELDGVALKGEQDIFGQPWEPERWTKEAANNATWHGGDWNGSSWTGLSWSGLSWSGLSWSGLSWSGLSWSGLSWSGLSWSGLSWSGLSWSGLSWSSSSR